MIGDQCRTIDTNISMHVCGHVFMLLVSLLGPLGIVVLLCAVHCDGKAFLQESPSMDLPMHYMGFGLSRELDWARDHVLRECIDHILNKRIQPAGVDIPPSEMPADIVVPDPPRPALNHLVWTDTEVAGIAPLAVPTTLLRMWSSHPQFGKEFQEWHEEAKATCFVDCGSDPPHRRLQRSRKPTAAPV